MKAIVNTGPGRLEMLEWPLPEPGRGQVRIRAGACGICATDLLMIAGWDRTGFPAIPGHEWAGMVDATGEGVDRSLVSRRCVAENVLSDGGEVGFEHPGGYAQYFLTEASRIRVLQDHFPLSSAALIEPLAVSVRAMRRLGKMVEPVLIFGDGPIGLLMLMLLVRQKVHRIVAIGGREHRLELAGELGAERTFNYLDFTGSLAEAIHHHTGTYFPTVIEATGSAAAMSAALDAVSREGRILVLGDYGPAKAGFPWNHLIHREIEMIASNASAGAWDEAVRLAVEERLPLDRLVTHRVPAERFIEGLELVHSQRSDVVKVVLEWDNGG